MLAWEFDNIFIVHGKHIVLGAPWQDFVESKSYPNFSLCMACVESMVLTLHGKNQRFKGETCSI